MTADRGEAGGGRVAADGSPVDVYLAIPPMHGFEAVVPTVEPGSTLLDLGCGVGRLATLLVDRGCEVTGVDASAAMLAEVGPGVERIHASIEGLELRRRFDVVVLASHLVNTAEDRIRRELLRTAARHVAPTGRVLLEHHHPATLEAPTPRTGVVGPVEVTFVVHAREGDDLDAEVVYVLGERRWAHRFRTRVFDIDALAMELATVGLVPVRSLSPTWLEAAAAGR